MLGHDREDTDETDRRFCERSRPVIRGRPGKKSLTGHGDARSDETTQDRMSGQRSSGGICLTTRGNGTEAWGHNHGSAAGGGHKAMHRQAGARLPADQSNPKSSPFIPVNLSRITWSRNLLSIALSRMIAPTCRTPVTMTASFKAVPDSIGASCHRRPPGRLCRIVALESICSPMQNIRRTPSGRSSSSVRKTACS